MHKRTLVVLFYKGLIPELPSKSFILLKNFPAWVFTVVTEWANVEDL
jgi:hypothetical protein